MRLLSTCSSESRASPRLPIVAIFRALLLFAFFYAACGSCCGQAEGALCSAGSGQFVSKFDTGVTVTVGAEKNEGFATRACEAALSWKKTSLTVVRDAWQVDIDLLGADLGQGGPVAAFQIQKSELDARKIYAVYALQRPPRLLRTISGGSFYRAADTDMDGHVEVWVHDAGGAIGFEGLPWDDFDFVPTLVLRFEGGRLLDVSSEFLSYFDRQIAQEEAALNPRQLSDFKKSDGKLLDLTPLQMGQLHLLLAAKMKILDIVWAYLYSGREEDAWHALRSMWPSADFDRVKAAILDAKAHGVSSQVDGVAPPASSRRRKRRVHIFDLTQTYAHDGLAPAPESSMDRSMAGANPYQGAIPSSRSLVSPKVINLFTTPPPAGQPYLPNGGLMVELVIDAARKVHSFQLADGTIKGPIVDALLAASANWKFIPAMSGDRPVACRIRLTLNPFR